MDRAKAFFVTAGSLFSSLLGILYVPVILMVSCNVIDYITGLLAAPGRGDRVNSARGLRGIAKKVCMWLLVVAGAIVDELLQYAGGTVGITLPFTFLVACIVCIWIICNELISILENIADIGVPIPVFLQRIIYYIKQQTESRATLPDDAEGGTGDEGEDI